MTPSSGSRALQIYIAVVVTALLISAVLELRGIW